MRYPSEVQSSKIAPGFLVASPSLACPFFNHTLVLMVEHGEEGSFGFVVNKATDMELGQILDQVGVDSEGDARASERLLHAQVLSGGPVSPETGWLVFDPDERSADLDDQVLVGEHVGLTASTDMLSALGQGKGPEKVHLFLGYSGWGPGQLEREMRDGSWIPVDLDARLLFETPLEDRWTAALAELGIDPARVVDGTVASA